MLCTTHHNDHIHLYQSLSAVLEKPDIATKDADISEKLQRLTKQLSRPIDFLSVSNIFM